MSISHVGVVKVVLTGQSSRVHFLQTAGTTLHTLVLKSHRKHAI